MTHESGLAKLYQQSFAPDISVYLMQSIPKPRFLSRHWRWHCAGNAARSYHYVTLNNENINLGSGRRELPGSTARPTFNFSALCQKTPSCSVYLYRTMWWPERLRKWRAWLRTIQCFRRWWLYTGCTNHGLAIASLCWNKGREKVLALLIAPLE